MTYKGADKRMASNGRPSDNAFFNNVISNTKLGTKFFDGDDNMVYGELYIQGTTGSVEINNLRQPSCLKGVVKNLKLEQMAAIVESYC